MGNVLEPPDDAAGPDEGAYDRVTNPGRYAVLHDAARALVDDLDGRFVIHRTVGPDADRRLNEPVQCLETWRLEPDNDGAPVTVGLTDFPGVVVRYGRWVVKDYPVCGCDACDEDPQTLVDNLTEHLVAVTAGRFTESRTSYEFRKSNGGREGAWDIERADEATEDGALREPPVNGWTAWNLRTS